MINENLIIKLLVEDLKFNQVNLALKTICAMEEQSLDIVSIVADLMEIDEVDVSNQWLDAYTSSMGRADQYPLWNEEALTAEARNCFEQLKSLN